ncbi:hypothetical protein L249_0980 [Ophiocordyceps polyrhachis-furcata BCC 54312]|uniref:Uncharacterized protein n=1 Tax=Ophiocordyceps polyrhachis-furcata BCC 54312 TaxID=1330021 RepID=A0A367LDE1_9HYPO|nr:hypothetical protein L249_0980 [Ophiocordyceps polyrhachis-furcata BCC 54312]
MVVNWGNPGEDETKRRIMMTCRFAFKIEKKEEEGKKDNGKEKGGDEERQGMKGCSGWTATYPYGVTVAPVAARRV